MIAVILWHQFVEVYCYLQSAGGNSPKRNYEGENVDIGKIIYSMLI